MAIVLGDPNQGGFHIPDLTRAYQQHPIVNLSPDRGGGGGGGGGVSNADAMVYQAENQQQRQIEHAQLQSWLHQQDLTQHEQMRLQQQQNALGYVMNDPNLSDEAPMSDRDRAQWQAIGSPTDEQGNPVDSYGQSLSSGMSERMQLAFQLRTGIDMGQQRQRAAQTRMQEERANQAMHFAAQEASRQQVEQRLIAAGFPQGQSYSLDPTIEQRVRDEMGQYLAPGEQLNDREVLQQVAREGGVTRYHQHRPGQFEQSGSDRVGADGQPAGQGGTSTGTRSRNAPGAPMSEQDFRKELKEIEALVTARLPTHQPGASGEGQRPTSFTDEDRSKLRNRLAREHGLYSEEDYQAGANPTYEHYLDQRTPGRREARARREQVETRSNQEYDRRESSIQHLPQGPEREALDLANHRIRDAIHRYGGGQMPESVRRGIGRMEQQLQEFERQHPPLVGPPAPGPAHRNAALMDDLDVLGERDARQRQIAQQQTLEAQAAQAQRLERRYQRPRFGGLD